MCWFYRVLSTSAGVQAISLPPDISDLSQYTPLGAYFFAKEKYKEKELNIRMSCSNPGHFCCVWKIFNLIYSFVIFTLI